MKSDLRLLLDSRERLRQALDVLTAELNAVEQQISKLQGDQKLDDAFFWRTVVTTLAAYPRGLSSRELFDRIVAQGLSININGLRVLLSRNRVKENLELSEDQLWHVTAKSAEAAYRKGLKVRRQSEKPEE